MGKEKEKEKTEKVVLKLRKKHPRKSFRLGKHVVGIKFKEYELNEAELKELESKGCKAWLISEKEFEAAKKAKAKKPAKKD